MTSTIKNKALSLPAILTGLFFFIVFLLLLSASMNTPLDHDENLFIAGGKLLAAKGMMPYVDYLYCHMPYLVFLYALIFRFCDWLLLSARLVSVTSSFLILVLVFFPKMLQKLKKETR